MSISALLSFRKRHGRATDVIAAFAIAATACGGREDGGENGGTGGGAMGGASTAVGDAGADVATVVARSCDIAVATLGHVTTDRYCTTVIRVPNGVSERASWSIACGPQKAAGEADARAAFAAQLPSQTTIERFVRVGPTGPTDDFFFYKAPNDIGGLGIVSYATSMLVFSGEVVWSGPPPKAVYPSAFADAPEVCPPFALSGVEPVQYVGLGDAPPEESPAAMDRASRTAVVRAIAGSHAFVHTYAVPFDGWVVVLDSALLE